MLSSKKYIIFDFDATIDTLLIDWEQYGEEFFKLVDTFDPSITISKMDTSYDFQIRCIEKLGEEINQAFIKYAEDFEKKYYTGHVPNEALIQFSRNNQEKYEFFLCTSNALSVVLPVLEELKIEKAFQKIIARGNVAFPKPHPDGFFQISAERGKKEDYVMIGDSDNDSRAAHNAGIDFIHVNDFEKLIQSL